jgi:hypothetical protein
MATSIASLPNELNTKSNEITLEVSDKTPNIVQPQQNYKASSEPMQQQHMSQQPAQQTIQQPVQTTNSKQNLAELSKDSINKIIQGLQDASQSGSTNLPSRDIPMMTEHIMHDNSARPNFVPSPPAEKANYIQDEETMETLINQKKNQYKHNMDNFYDEIQTPLLIMLMYFIFQLPTFKNSMLKNFPLFFFKNKEYNLKGMVFNTILFGGFYYLIMKSIKYLSEL